MLSTSAALRGVLPPERTVGSSTTRWFPPLISQNSEANGSAIGGLLGGLVVAMPVRCWPDSTSRARRGTPTGAKDGLM